MIARIVTAWACLVGLVAAVESLTNPSPLSLSPPSEDAFKAFAFSDLQELQDYLTPRRPSVFLGLADDLRKGEGLTANGSFGRRSLVLNRAPTGVLAEIMTNPSEATRWWRSCTGVTDWVSVHYVGPGELASR